MVRIYRNLHLCAKISFTDEGTYQVSVRKASHKSADPNPEHRRFDNWPAAARFVEAASSQW